MRVSLAVASALVIAAACAAPAPARSTPSPAASPTASPAATPEPTIDPQVGWRLVAAADRSAQWAFSVHAAESAEEWSELWGEISPGLEVPQIDFATEIAAVFADGTGGPGNCSERRLDGVVIDPASMLVYAEIVDPLAPRACDAMLGGSSVFVVALSRAALPPSPFTLRLSREQRCADCPESLTVDLR